MSGLLPYVNAERSNIWILIKYQNRYLWSILSHGYNVYLPKLIGIIMIMNLKALQQDYGRKQLQHAYMS